MDVVSEADIIKGLLTVHVGVSTVTSSFTTIYAVSVYLFATSLLLLAAVLLFIIHWRHQVLKSRRKQEMNRLDSPDAPLTRGEHQYQMKEYETLQLQMPSSANIRMYDNRYSQYDNYNDMSNDYHKDYEGQSNRKAELV